MINAKYISFAKWSLEANDLKNIKKYRKIKEVSDTANYKLPLYTQEMFEKDVKSFAKYKQKDIKKNTIILALNWAEREGYTYPEFANFHEFYHASKDRYLAMGLVDSAFENTLMSDVIKNYKKTKSDGVAKKLQDEMKLYLKNPKDYKQKDKLINAKEQIDMLIEEIKYVIEKNKGGYFNFVCLGTNVANLMNKIIMSNDEIKNILNNNELIPVVSKLYHYSFYGGKTFKQEGSKNYVMLNQFNYLDSIVNKLNVVDNNKLIKIDVIFDGKELTSKIAVK